jgi:hypothetical protein
MTEKKFKYTAKIKQPQTVADFKLDPGGGNLSEREYKTLKKDAYGASLLEKGLLAVEEAPASKPGRTGNTGKTGADGAGEIVPDFDGKHTSKDRPENHAGWKPE